jgi:hypothetical protein
VWAILCSFNLLVASFSFALRDAALAKVLLAYGAAAEKKSNSKILSPV